MTEPGENIEVEIPESKNDLAYQYISLVAQGLTALCILVIAILRFMSNLKTNKLSDLKIQKYKLSNSF